MDRWDDEFNKFIIQREVLNTNKTQLVILK